MVLISLKNAETLGQSLLPDDSSNGPQGSYQCVDPYHSGASVKARHGGALCLRRFYTDTGRCVFKPHRPQPVDLTTLNSTRAMASPLCQTKVIPRHDLTRRKGLLLLRRCHWSCKSLARGHAGAGNSAETPPVRSSPTISEFSARVGKYPLGRHLVRTPLIQK